MFGKGMEMMVISAIKAAGIDPDVLMARVTGTIQSIEQHLHQFGARLESIDERLSRLEKAAGIEEKPAALIESEDCHDGTN